MLQQKMKEKYVCEVSKLSKDFKMRSSGFVSKNMFLIWRWCWVFFYENTTTSDKQSLKKIHVEIYTPTWLFQSTFKVLFGSW